jgi:hypothetical protein
MPDPTRTPPPAQPTPPLADTSKDKKNPARDVHDGDFDESAAGEEDPGAGVDALVPKH